jgi:hypothetical protein
MVPVHATHGVAELTQNFVSLAQVAAAVGPVIGQRWYPVLQARTHAPVVQATVPVTVAPSKGGGVQVAQDVPQAVTVVLVTQVGVARVPRRQKPGASHWTRQVKVPGFATLSHAAIPSAAGAGQALHDVPQLARAVFDTHRPVPVGQR